MTSRHIGNASQRRRMRATILSLACSQGRGDDKGADCVACNTRAIVGLGSDDPDKFELGHMLPDAMGGRYEVKNLVPMCAQCNSQLGDVPIWEAFTPRYDVHAGWNGKLAADPGPKPKPDRRALWLPPR